LCKEEMILTSHNRLLPHVNRKYT